MEKLDDEDCCVVESDSSISPNGKEHAIRISNLSISDDEEVCFIAEQEGVVACRDYPHPRHICAQFPFAKTPHDEHCQKCYCYICEEVAPCKSWIKGDHSGGGHCHATDTDLIWKLEKALSRIIHPAEPCQPTTPSAVDRYRLAMSISPTSTTATPNYVGDKPTNEDRESLTYIGGILYDENKNWEFVIGYGLKIYNETYPNPDIQFYVALQKGLELAWSIGIRKLCLDLDSTCYNTIQRHFDVGREILHYEVISEEEEKNIHLWNHLIENTSTGGVLYGILKDVQDCLNRGWSVSARCIAPSKILQEPNAYALVKLAEVQRERMQVYDFSSSDSLKQLVQSLADQYIRSCLN